MMRRNDPRLRQTLNQLSQNLESANETAQEGIYTFSHDYIDPCFTGIKECLGSCTAQCFPSRKDAARRGRGRTTRGRAESTFTFYDDWDDDEDADDGIFGGGIDELDRLLAGSGSRSQQPRRQRAMSYGTRGARKSSGKQAADAQDPNIIPSSSVIGFLERLPWVGGRGIRYQPSAADLQENPGGFRVRDVEQEQGEEHERDALIEESDASDVAEEPTRRKRSETVSSQSTGNSFSSRGDLFPSDDEDVGDAVPLDDSFAVTLERRMTGNFDDQSSGRQSKRPSMSRASTKTASLKDRRVSRGSRTSLRRDTASPISFREVSEPMSIQDLKEEEDKVREEEEAEIERKRIAAHRLAASRGLDPDGFDDKV